MIPHDRDDASGSISCAQLIRLVEWQHFLNVLLWLVCVHLVWLLMVWLCLEVRPGMQAGCAWLLVHERCINVYVSACPPRQEFHSRKHIREYHQVMSFSGGCSFSLSVCSSWSRPVCPDLRETVSLQDTHDTTKSPGAQSSPSDTKLWLTKHCAETSMLALQNFQVDNPYRVTHKYCWGILSEWMTLLNYEFHA